MQKLFNRILVPINFNAGSGIVLRKAAELALKLRCSLILLGVTGKVQPSDNSADGSAGNGESHINPLLQEQLDESAVTLKAVTQGKIMVSSLILSGDWNACALQAVRDLSIDLVVLGVYDGILFAHSDKFDPDLIASETHVPVFTVPESQPVSSLMRIIIPVTDFLPVRKLLYGVYLAMLYKATVQLLGIQNEKNRVTLPFYLEKSYSLLRDNCEVPVAIDLVRGENIGKVFKRYSHSHPSGVFIVHPGFCKRVNNQFIYWWQRMTRKKGGFTILTVTPV